MTRFAYQAYDAKGKVATGALEATSERQALEQLQQKGVYPFSVKQDNVTRNFSWLTAEIGSSKLSLKDRAQFLRMLGSLLQAGITVDRSVGLIAEDAGSKKIGKAALAAKETLVSGQSLSTALDRVDGFKPEEAGLIRAGEQTGQVASAINDLALLLERRGKMRDQISSQLAYPIILIVMALLSLGVIATVLVPSVAPVFAQAGKPLPTMLRFLGWLSGTVQNNPLQVAGGSVLALLLSFVFFRSMTAKSLFDGMFYHLPISQKGISGRFCRVLGTLLKNGAYLQTALRLALESTANKSMQVDGVKALEDVVSGRKLSQALQGLKAMDSSALRLVAIGEETNRLDDMLLHVAERNETAVARAMERFVTLLTPALTIVLGLMIGSLILSVMRVVLSLNELAL